MSVDIFDCLIGQTLTKAFTSNDDENEALLLVREEGGTV